MDNVQVVQHAVQQIVVLTASIYGGFTFVISLVVAIFLRRLDQRQSLMVVKEDFKALKDTINGKFDAVQEDVESRVKKSLCLERTNSCHRNFCGKLDAVKITVAECKNEFSGHSHTTLPLEAEVVLRRR